MFPNAQHIVTKKKINNNNVNITKNLYSKDWLHHKHDKEVIAITEYDGKV